MKKLPLFVRIPSVEYRKLRAVSVAADAALTTYEGRFGSSRAPGDRPRNEVNYIGPIDEEMQALRLALA